MVADVEELEKMDASELHARRLNEKEVLTPQRSGNFTFPVADGTVQIFGCGEQRLRTSTLNRDRPEYIDVTRTTHTSLDVLLEKHIDDHWNKDGER